jgi:hypothetical protein
MENKILDSNILAELIKNQRKNIPQDKKLLYNDLKRLSKYLSNTIFTEKCSLWNGYITTIKNDEKNSYINFYFNGKKYALHRLLYINFIGDLGDNEYIKFKCANKGKCCCLSHFYKINNETEVKNSTNLTKNNNENNNDNKINPENDNKINNKQIIVDFDI